MFVCLFVYILSLSLFLFVCLLLSTSARVSRFFLFPRPSPRDLSRVARVVLWEGRGIFFWRVRESRMPRHVPFPSRNKASKHPTWIRFPDLDLLLSRISLPLFFTHCRSSSKFSSIPLYRVTRPTYRVTKTYIVGKRLDFSQPPSTDWNTRKRPLGFYTRVRYVRARIQGVPFSTFSKMVARRRRMIFKSVGISIRKLMIIKEE